MKTALLACVLTCSFYCYSQSNIPPVAVPPQNVPYATKVNLTTDDEWFKDRRVNHYWEDSYVINGRRVFGSPFLYHDWETGEITTADGRLYTGYKLKYDAFNQVVYFTNGTGDSLQVDEEIKEFKLTVVYPDTVINCRLVNANQFKKEKKSFYYEVLLDDAAGELLKYNKKIVADADKSMPAYEGKKFFDLEVSFFYYDKKNNSINPIKANGSNITAILNLDDNLKNRLKPEGYDFSVEANIVSFFRQYFEVLKK